MTHPLVDARGTAASARLETLERAILVGVAAFDHEFRLIDLVIRAKRSAYAASFAVLRAELTGAVETLT